MTKEDYTTSIGNFYEVLKNLDVYNVYEGLDPSKYCLYRVIEINTDVGDNFYEHGLVRYTYIDSNKVFKEDKTSIKEFCKDKKLLDENSHMAILGIIFRTIE